MGLTAEERHYDWAVTEGRFWQESAALEAGYTVGILSDYLVGDLYADYDPDIHTYFGDTHALFRQGVEEGQDIQDRHTGEELYIWAWEFDKDVFGLKGIYPLVKREPLTIPA